MFWRSCGVLLKGIMSLLFSKKVPTVHTTLNDNQFRACLHHGGKWILVLIYGFDISFFSFLSYTHVLSPFVGLQLLLVS